MYFSRFFFEESEKRISYTTRFTNLFFSKKNFEQDSPLLLLIEGNERRRRQINSLNNNKAFLTLKFPATSKEGNFLERFVCERYVPLWEELNGVRGWGGEKQKSLSRQLTSSPSDP